jgi:hypothetical protein
MKRRFYLLIFLLIIVTFYMYKQDEKGIYQIEGGNHIIRLEEGNFEYQIKDSIMNSGKYEIIGQLIYLYNFEYFYDKGFCRDLAGSQSSTWIIEKNFNELVFNPDLSECNFKRRFF